MNRTGQFTKLIPLLLALVLALALPLAGCRKVGVPGAGMSPVRNRDFNIELSISHFPKLYEPFTITATFTPYEQDQPDAELWIGGGVYLDGEWVWHGPLKKGETKVLSATFAFVQEGNTGVGASAWGLRGLNYSLPFNLHVTREGSHRDWVLTPGRARSWKPGDPYQVPAGASIVTDTGLLLNTLPEPRIEFVQSEEDIRRLQEEGLFPPELRYQWEMIDNQRVDFSKYFLIVFWDGMRPNRGHWATFDGDIFLWDGVVVRGGFRTYSLPPDVPVPGIPTSAIVVQKLSYETTPAGGVDILAFQGTRSFEFTLNGKLFTTITAELKPALQPGLPEKQ